MERVLPWLTVWRAVPHGVKNSSGNGPPALVHGLTMLQIDGQLTQDKVGSKPVAVALDCLLDGLKA